MGSVYRRQVKFCTTCDRRLDTIAARQACDAAGHAIDLRDQGPWWIKYQVAGRPVCVSSESDRKEDAKRLLKLREGDVGKGVPIRSSRTTTPPGVPRDGAAGGDPTLRDAISERGAMRPADAARWFTQIFEAIALAHANGIIHRDLKPENIFLAGHDSRGAIAKVLAFGLAKVTPQNSLTRANLTSTR